MKARDYITLKKQLEVLREVALDYGGRTIDNIIQQIEMRLKEEER